MAEDVETISLTEKGNLLLQTCNDVIANIENEIFSEFDEDTLQHFRETLQRIYRRIQGKYSPR